MTFQSHILPEHDVRPYSIAQLADRWGCSDSMIRKLINQGELQTFRIGALIRISAAEVERYEKCPAEPTSPIPSNDSGEALPSSGENQPKAESDTGGSSHRKIGRAPRRKPAPSGKGPTIVRGPWGAS
jgi:excisionase family DNA binding protein